MISKILTFWCGLWCGVLACLVLLVAALSLSGCAASRPAPATDVPALPAVDVAKVQHLDSAVLRGWLPADLSALPPYLVPAPAGSTPRQRRQWQRAQAQNLARAGVLPSKVKNSSVATAPGASAVNRPAAPVALGPNAAATDARKAGQRHGASAVGPGAQAQAIDKSGGPPWWVYLVVAVVGAVGWEIVSAKVAPVRALLRWRN